MVIAVRRTAWQFQPPQGRGIDKSNQITLGLSALFNAAEGREVVYNNFASSLTTTRSAGKGGICADFSSTANQQYAHRPGYAITGDLTIFVVATFRAFSNYSAIIAKQATTTTYCPYELRLGVATTDSKMNLVRASSSSFVTTAGTSNAITADSGSVQTFGWVIPAPSGSGVTTQPYLNGAALNPINQGALSSAADNGSSSVWIGRRYDGSTQLDGRIYYVALWNRLLSGEEIERLNSNPWQVFEP